VSATGEIAATNLVDVGAQVSGQIKKMHVKIGDVVKEGDLIAEIDNVTQVNEVNTRKAQLQTYQAQLESAQVALKIAQRKYSRYKSLASADAVSKEEFEARQMREIRFGLENNIDVFVYLNNNFNYLQMRQIRFGLEYGLNVSVYAKPEIKDWDMKKIGLKMLEEGTL